jgi:hypothetical protein
MVAQLTRCRALDLTPFGIRVKGVDPGWIRTPEVDDAADLDGGGRAKWGPVWGRFHMRAARVAVADVGRSIRSPGSRASASETPHHAGGRHRTEPGRYERRTAALHHRIAHKGAVGDNMRAGTPPSPGPCSGHGPAVPVMGGLPWPTSCAPAHHSFFDDGARVDGGTIAFWEQACRAPSARASVP